MLLLGPIYRLLEVRVRSYGYLGLFGVGLGRLGIELGLSTRVSICACGGR